MGRSEALPPLPAPLRAMVEEGRLVHSICLEGPPGIGKRETALALAGAVLCDRERGEMCGSCTPCRRVLEGVHGDVTLIDQQTLPKQKQVDFIRALRAGAYQSPREGRAKVYIFADAPLLSRDSQNILLKIIEEPPPDTFFLFTCDNRYRLLPTILSRVVTVSLPPLTVSECLARLRRRVPGRTGEEYREAALLSCGSPGEGEQILSQEKAAKKARAARTLVEAMAARNPYQAIAAATPFEKSREDYTALLEAASCLAMLPELREELHLSPARGMALRQRLEQTLERNRQKGYLPLLTALLAAD